MAGVYPSDHQFVIVIDAVMTETHLDFGPPESGQLYRYRRIAVRFPNVRQVEWLQQPPLRGQEDPDGTIDYGNIDFFTRSGDRSHLGGYWGEVEIRSDLPVVDLLEST